MLDLIRGVENLSSLPAPPASHVYLFIHCSLLLIFEFSRSRQYHRFTVQKMIRMIASRPKMTIYDFKVIFFGFSRSRQKPKSRFRGKKKWQITDLWSEK